MEQRSMCVTHDWVSMTSNLDRVRTRVLVEECQNKGCEEVRVNGITNTTAEVLYDEVEELYGADILEEPDAEDAADQRGPMWDAFTAYRDARARAERQ